MNKLIGLVGALVLAITAPALAQQMPTGLQGIKIAVADYERATRFYAILGMVPGTKYNGLEWQLRWTEPARGVPVIHANPRATIMMIKDPDGNSVELLGPPAGASAPPAPHH